MAYAGDLDPTLSSTSIRDRIPVLVREPDIFNPHFFQGALELIKGALASNETVLVNSGAEIRGELLHLMLGPQAERVKSSIKPEKDLVEMSWDSFSENLEKNKEFEGTQEQKLAIYSILASLSKLVIRDYEGHKEGGVASATDTINYVRTAEGQFERMEKPVSYEIACQQVDDMFDNGDFLIANASVVGKIGQTGEFGASMWLLPARFSFPDTETKEIVRGSVKEKLRLIFNEGKTTELRPGGLSAVDELFIDYLELGLLPTEDGHEVLDDVRSSDFTFNDFLGSVKSWFRLNDDSKLTSTEQVVLGAAVIGGPAHGMLRAVERYVASVKSNSGERVDHQKIRNWVVDLCTKSQ